jgi:hypothetical protein
VLEGVESARRRLRGDGAGEICKFLLSSSSPFLGGNGKLDVVTNVRARKTAEI